MRDDFLHRPSTHLLVLLRRHYNANATKRCSWRFDAIFLRLFSICTPTLLACLLPTAWLTSSIELIQMSWFDSLKRKPKTSSLLWINSGVGRTKAGNCGGFTLPLLIVPRSNKIMSVDTQQIMTKTMPCKLICNQKRRKSHMALRHDYN